MKRFLLSFLILVNLSPAFSQKLYFIYLQTDNDQPFFVKMDEKIFSSSANGYLVLSKLRDSTYAFSIGFPQNKYPELRFSLDIRGRDRGYLLKDFGEKGWGLFDLQSLSIVIPLPPRDAGRIKIVPRDDVSEFTEVLSRAANDPSLKEIAILVKKEEDATAIVQPAVVKEEVKPAVIKEETKIVDSPASEKKAEAVVENKPSADSIAVVAGKGDSITARQNPGSEAQQHMIVEVHEPQIEKKEVVPDTLQAKPETAAVYKPSVVTRKSESSTTEGFGLTFIDEYSNGRKDTIRITIPNPRRMTDEIKEPPQKDVRFLDITSDTAGTVRPVAAEGRSTDTPAVTEPSIAKQECPAVATDGDFLKLQKKMMSERGDENMIDEAKKVFRTRCFSSIQLKTLSILFTNDNGKYKFFDAAYPHVSDPANFPSLSSELKDDYYVNRFKAMLR